MNRKEQPVFSGVLMYFPDALLAVSSHSKKGNDKHNPGQPLHWDKSKSSDHADCIARHLMDIGPNWDAVDEETKSYHATALAWRSLALLQTLLERKKNDLTATSFSQPTTQSEGPVSASAEQASKLSGELLAKLAGALVMGGLMGTEKKE